MHRFVLNKIVVCILYFFLLKLTGIVFVLYIQIREDRQTSVSNLTYQCIQTTINTNESHPCDHGVIAREALLWIFKVSLRIFNFSLWWKVIFSPQTFQWSQASLVSPKNNNNKIYVTVWWGNTSLCLREAVGCYHF